jgi:basic membrane protein A
MKRIDVAAYSMIKAELDKKFPGGKTLIFDAKNDGVGIPATNPNLGADVTKKAADIMAQIKAGKIVVSAEKGDLIK